MKKNQLTLMVLVLVFICGFQQTCFSETPMPLEQGIDRLGSDYESVDTSSPEECRETCNKDPHCKAFTFVKDSNTCWLKEGVPEPLANENCVSGVKGLSKDGIITTDENLKLEYGIDRFGSDYKNIELDSDDPSVCRQNCKDEAECKAFTFVKAGVQGEKAMCYLKSEVPEASENPDCISGIKK